MYRLDRMLSPDQFIQTFLAVNAEDSAAGTHPWDLHFREGKCTRQQLQGWAKERYYFLKQVPVKEYCILSNCPFPEVRRVWLTKAIEEEGEDIIGRSRGPHPEYWLNVCEALGLPREYVVESDPLPAVKFAVDTFTHMAAKSWLVGIAMSEGDETAKGMARALETFRKHYSWLPDEALEFYRIHSVVDVDHGQKRLEILAKYCVSREIQEECINAQLVKNNIMRVMYDAVYVTYVIQGVKCHAPGVRG